MRGDSSVGLGARRPNYSRELDRVVDIDEFAPQDQLVLAAVRSLLDHYRGDALGVSLVTVARGPRGRCPLEGRNRPVQ